MLCFLVDWAASPLLQNQFYVIGYHINDEAMSTGDLAVGHIVLTSLRQN